MLRQVALFCVWLMIWPLQASQAVKPTLKEQVVLINPGSVIEVVLKNKEKFSGRIGAVTDTGFDVQYVVKDQTTMRTVPFDQVKKVKQQREQVQQYVIQLEKQLPSKSEMAALLSDINQAGLGRSLQFELFKPGTEAVKDFYAELPITVRVSGQFHDMGMFASDVAHLSRIVTLNDLSVAPKGKDGVLTLDATAKTYRYLDPEEISGRAGAQKTKRGGQ